MFGKSTVVTGVVVKPEIGKRAVFEITETSPETGRKLKREIETGIITDLYEDRQQEGFTYGCICSDGFATYNLYQRRIA